MNEMLFSMNIFLVCNEIMKLDNNLNFFLRVFFSVLILIENVNHVFCSVEVVLEIMKQVPVAKYFPNDQVS